MSAPVSTHLLDSLPLIRQGKVRDCYQLGEDLLFVASDRISAFDVILPSAIPGKGAVLNQLSGFWFGKTAHIVPNHIVQVGLPPTVQTTDRAWFDARSTVARRADRIDFECVVRGYLAGSGWKEYQESGQLAGHALPAGLPRAARLPEPIFTPAMKNDVGHDENITVERLQDLVGIDIAARLESLSLELYRFAADQAAKSGLILADTKFEFGMIVDQLTLIDEILTPDSSRYWEAATWTPGREPDSFDKQYVRNWLDSSGWNHEPPAPILPDEVIQGTQRRYVEAFRRLTGAEPVF
ncbi:MAG TPA: phosphoribosylaminoimidazolesuccinocarboxamide synthase [Thermomicrobiales bacterium]|nr:phosphoribosylaminoimidazolesuccinocarboxamide synthase [Thermomicrobiales bacterium]